MDLISIGKKAFLTKKREPENYIDPKLLLDDYGVSVSFNDKDDAKNIIAKALKIRDTYVIENVWPKMSASQVFEASIYEESGTQRNEFLELMNEFESI